MTQDYESVVKSFNQMAIQPNSIEPYLRELRTFHGLPFKYESIFIEGTTDPNVNYEMRNPRVMRAEVFKAFNVKRDERPSFPLIFTFLGEENNADFILKIMDVKKYPALETHFTEFNLAFISKMNKDPKYWDYVPIVAVWLHGESNLCKEQNPATIKDIFTKYVLWVYNRNAEKKSAVYSKVEKDKERNQRLYEQMTTTEIMKQTIKRDVAQKLRENTRSKRTTAKK
jgi:hypothetical protein